MRSFAFFALASLAVVALPLHAQDAHYWTVQYGPRASLLGGGVIGSVNDVSATFYNPGGLAMADSLSFAISLNVFQRTETTVEGEVLGREDLMVSHTGLAPSMLGGAIKGPTAEGGSHFFAYSLITRQRSRYSISDVKIGAPAGYETLASHVSLRRNASEQWAGISWAHAIRPNFGIGVTTFVSMRHDSRAMWAEVAGSQAGEGVVASRLREFEYDHYIIIGKFGALLDLGSFAAGLTLTAPSARVYGSASANYVDVDVKDETGGDPPQLAVTESDGLSATHKQPFSIGAGLRGGSGSFQAYLSAEWFAALGEYEVLRSGPPQTHLSTRSPEYVVSDERVSVFNWAVSAEQRVSRTVTTYASYATDFSWNSSADTNLAVSSWDIRTVSLGVDLRIRGRSLTLGGAYGWGSDTTRDLRHLPPEQSLDPPLAFEPVPVGFRSFRLILGFEF